MTMKEKKKAASTTANLLNNRSKDNKSFRIKQQIRKLFLDGGTAFSFKKYCSSLVIVVKILIFAHSDAEAPP